MLNLDEENKEALTENSDSETAQTNDMEASAETPAAETPAEDIVAEFVKDASVDTSDGDGKDGKKDKKADDRKKRRNKILAYIAFILLNALVIAILLIVEDKSGDTASGREAFRLLGQNWTYTVLALLMFFVIVICDTIVFKLLISKTGTEKYSAVLPLKVSLLGRYYDRITPWSMGGEPFQIAFLMRGGVSGSDSCAVTMSRHIVRFFTNAALVIGILVASRIATEIWVMVVAILSVLAGLIIPSFMLLCSFKPKVGNKIASGVVKFLCKIKIFKDYDKQMAKIQGDIDKFLGGIRYLSSNKQIIAVIAIAAAIELFATNSVPFFVMRALGHPEVGYWRILVLCIFVNYASSFAPTPGGAGIAELSFYAIFAATIDGGYLFWAVLFWRIAIFYVPVFLGFIIQTADSVISIIKAGRAK